MQFTENVCARYIWIVPTALQNGPCLWHYKVYHAYGINEWVVGYRDVASMDLPIYNSYDIDEWVVAMVYKMGRASGTTKYIMPTALMNGL